MELNDSKYINSREAFAIYMSVKLSLSDGYNIDKYGLYANKFQVMFDDPSHAKILFEKAASKYQTEYRWATALAGNLIIDPGKFVTDIEEEHYLRLRRYNSSVRYFEQQATELFRISGKSKSLFETGKILELFVAGEISPELFSSLGVFFDYDKFFKASPQAFMWGLLSKRLRAYEHYVTINANRQQLSSCLKSILTSL